MTEDDQRKLLYDAMTAEDKALIDRFRERAKDGPHDGCVTCTLGIGWWNQGKNYGIPECCIHAFIIDALQMHTPDRPRVERSPDNGFIPCVECLADVLAGNRPELHLADETEPASARKYEDNALGTCDLCRDGLSYAEPEYVPMEGLAARRRGVNEYGL